jgi:hypothetical protein
MPTKTANIYLSDKVALRANHLPVGRELYILDCFAGKGLIWAAVKELTGRHIVTLPIDTDKAVGFRLPGDNRAYLDTLDLDQFDAIDLDAYGIPYDQLKIVLERGYRGAVFVTFIQSIYGQMPVRLLQDVGFSKEMVDRTPTIFGDNGWSYFLEWLALQGVKQVVHRSHLRKHYLYFSLGKVKSEPVARKPILQRQKRVPEVKKMEPAPLQLAEPVQEEKRITAESAPVWRGSRHG